MAGKIDKGFISKIFPEPKDWYGHPTKAQINPCTNSGAVTPALTINWPLRGQNGQLKIGDEVAYCLFDDGTGVIFARLDGENSGIVDYNVETTGFTQTDKTHTVVGDTFHKSNVTTDLVTTSKGQIIGQGGMAISGSAGGGASATITGDIDLKGKFDATGDVTAGGISLQGHTHDGVHGPTGPAH